MPTPEQALTYLMGTYTRQARKLTQYANIHEMDIDAYLLGSYLTAINAQLNQLPDYQPIKELEMVLRVCQKAKEDGIQTQCFDFWAYLYGESQKLIEALKKSDASLASSYEEKFKIFELFGLSLEDYKSEVAELDAVTLAGEIGKLWDDKKEQRLQALSGQVEGDTIGNYDTMDFENLKKQKEKHGHAQNALEAIQAGNPSKAQLEMIIGFVVGQYARGNRSMLKSLAETLATVEDKRQASSILLTLYQQTDASIDRYSVGAKNMMLLGFADLAQCLEGLLPKAEVMALIKETGFTLQNPHKCENNAEYKRFLAERNGYIGEADLTQLDEEDFYSPIMMGSLAAGLLSSTTFAKDPAHLTAVLSSPIPPLIMAECEKDPALMKAFIQFHQAFLKVNKRAGERDRQHYRDPDLFFMRYQAAIAQQLMLFGLDGVKMLKAELAETVVSLERVCENLAVVDNTLIDPLRAYFDEHRALIVKDPSEYEACHKLILTLSTLCDMQNEILYYAGEKKAFRAKLLNDMEGKKPSEYLNIIFRQLLTTMLGEHEVDVESLDIDAIFKRMPPEKFTQLVAASLRMQESEYKAVFSQLLYLDLTGGDVDAFLHHVEQADELGRSLAGHNRRIQEKLRAQDIDPQMALKYPKYRDMVIYPGDGEGAKIDNALTVLWTYCQSFKGPLDEKITALKAIEADDIGQGDKKILQQCLSIEKQLTQIEKKIEASGGNLVRTLAKPDVRAQFDKIERNLKALQSTYEKHQRERQEASSALFTPSFMEFLGHVRDQYAQVSSMGAAGAVKPKASKAAPSKPRSIRFLQWDKRDPMTSFLGDEVGCCLGSRSSQFPALVQRRMDDGMLFHVAVDLETGKPAALIWLYLAEKPDGKIAAVANFFEVNTKYAVDEMTRKALLNGLCAFTQDYCADNKIEDFYMNVLTYGWNIHDLHGYPVVDFRLKDKLGGPFLPGYEGQELTEEEMQQIRQFTGQHYYLASLQKGDAKFHHFDPAVLALEQAAIPNAITVESLLEKGIKACLSEHRAKGAPSSKEMATYLIKHHGLELAPFFEGPLAEDQNFVGLVEETGTKVLATLTEGLKEEKVAAPKKLKSPPHTVVREQGLFFNQKKKCAGSTQSEEHRADETKKGLPF